ncbi:MAG: TetR/AcrR family transcriptional regulator [Patulibacter minatonensis]
MTTTPGSGGPGRADARRNRDRILDAAVDVLAADPRAGLPEVAQAAGVSRATVYRHFPDIATLRAALVEDAQEIGRQMLQEHLPAILEREPDASIDRFFGLLNVALPIEHRWTRMIAGEPLPDAPFIEAFAPTVRAVIKRAQVRGELRADLDLEVVPEVLMSLAMLAVRKVHADGMAPERASEIVRTYVDGMRPRGSR